MVFLETSGKNYSLLSPEPLRANLPSSAQLFQGAIRTQAQDLKMVVMMSRLKPCQPWTYQLAVTRTRLLWLKSAVVCKQRASCINILTIAIKTTAFLITPFPAPLISLWTPQDSFYEALLDYSQATVCFQICYIYFRLSCMPSIPSLDWEPLKVRGPHVPALSVTHLSGVHMKQPLNKH